MSPALRDLWVEIYVAWVKARALHASNDPVRAMAAERGARFIATSDDGDARAVFEAWVKAASSCPESTAVALAAAEASPGPSAVETQPAEPAMTWRSVAVIEDDGQTIAILHTLSPKQTLALLAFAAAGAENALEEMRHPGTPDERRKRLVAARFYRDMAAGLSFADPETELGPPPEKVSKVPGAEMVAFSLDRFETLCAAATRSKGTHGYVLERVLEELAEEDGSERYSPRLRAHLGVCLRMLREELAEQGEGGGAHA